VLRDYLVVWTLKLAASRMNNASHQPAYLTSSASIVHRPFSFPVPNRPDAPANKTHQRVHTGDATATAAGEGGVGRGDCHCDGGWVGVGWWNNHRQITATSKRANDVRYHSNRYNTHWLEWWRPGDHLSITRY